MEYKSFTRNLKYYSWVFLPQLNKVNLVKHGEPEGKYFEMSMAMADSFVRAYISFKNNQRLNEKEMVRQAANTRINNLTKRIIKMTNRIAVLKVRLVKKSKKLDIESKSVKIEDNQRKK